MKSFWLASACVFAFPVASFAQGNTAPAVTPAGDVAVTASPTAPAAVSAGDPVTPTATTRTAETSNEPGEIVITATRRNQTLSNVPIAVSAVSQQSLQNSGANDIRALNQLAPSLLVSSTGNEANGSARIRGIGTVGDNPGLESSVAVFIDGVYRSRTGSGLNELGEIDRIEVLRGPQGTLFGRNASAGLINIITAKPSFELGGNAEGTYGNYDYYRLAGGLTGPIIADKLAARIDGVYVNRNGFNKDVISGDRSNDRDRYFVRGQLLFTPTDDISLRLIGDYSHRNETCCSAVYTSTRETFDATPNAVAGVNGDNNVSVAASNRIVQILQSLGGVFPTPGDPYSRHVVISPGRTYQNKTTDWGGSGQLDWDLGDVKLTSITAYREYKAGNAADIDYSNVDLAYHADDGNSYRRFKTFTQEVRLNGSLFDGRLDWLVGGFYSREKLQVADNTTFGSQYGAFAACRVVANVSPAAVLRNPSAPGCLSPTGLATLNGALGAGAAPIIAGLNRLSALNNLGSTRDTYNQDSQNYAFFTHNIFKITDRLSLTLGVRYTHEKKDFDANFNNNNTVCPTQQAALGPLLANPGLAALAGGIITLSCVGNSSSAVNLLNLNSTLKEGQFTGTGVLSWKPIDSTLLYASYAKGYKAGGFNLDRSPLGGVNGVLTPRTIANTSGDELKFDAEKVDSYEIGAKFKTRGFSLNAAIFREEFKSFQLNTFNGSVFIVQNINSCGTSLNGADTDNSPATGVCNGKTKPGVIAQGVELEAVISPVRDLQFTVGYTYSDTKYAHNLFGGKNAALSNALFLLPGSQVSNAPKNVVTTSAAWTPDIGSSGLSALFYVDSRLTSDYNTGSDLFPEKEQASFVTVNARIGIRGPSEKWSLEFWGQNIFGVNYQQVAFNTPFQGANSSAQVAAFGGTGNQLFSAFLAEPRTYGATVRFRF